MSYQGQDPVAHRFVCERHELQRNLSLINVELHRHSENLRTLASALDQVVSEGESSEVQADVFTHLSTVNHEAIRKLLVERSKTLVNLAEIKTRIAAQGV